MPKWSSEVGPGSRLKKITAPGQLRLFAHSLLLVPSAHPCDFFSSRLERICRKFPWPRHAVTSMHARIGNISSRLAQPHVVARRRKTQSFSDNSNSHESGLDADVRTTVRKREEVQWDHRYILSTPAAGVQPPVSPYCHNSVLYIPKRRSSLLKLEARILLQPHRPR